MSEQMSVAMEEGAISCAAVMTESGSNDDDGVRFIVERKRARDATVQDLASAAGYLFCAPENLASVSGEMLEFFHRNYYHLFETNDADSDNSYSETSILLGRPYAIAVAAGADGSSAANQMTRICTGWRLQAVADPLIIQNGQPQRAKDILKTKICVPDGDLAKCSELGGLLAANLLL